MLPSEARLWSCLQNAQLHGRKFRRQHSIENFIVDFYCPGEKLIVEVDGKSHDDIGSQNSDIVRDERLKQIGYKVYRVNASELINNMEGVLNEISEYFKF